MRTMIFADMDMTDKQWLEIRSLLERFEPRPGHPHPAFYCSTCDSVFETREMTFCCSNCGATADKDPQRNRVKCFDSCGRTGTYVVFPFYSCNSGCD